MDGFNYDINAVININGETRPKTLFRCLPNVCRFSDGGTGFTLWVAPLPNHFETTENHTRFKVWGFALDFLRSYGTKSIMSTAFLKNRNVHNDLVEYSVILDLSNNMTRFYSITDPSEELRIVFNPNAKSDLERISFEPISQN
jgi:hypothetical protein